METAEHLIAKRNHKPRFAYYCKKLQVQLSAGSGQARYM